MATVVAALAECDLDDDRPVPLTEIVHVKVLTVDADGDLGPLSVPRALDAFDRLDYHAPLTLEYEGIGDDPRDRVDHALRVIRSHPLLSSS